MAKTVVRENESLDDALRRFKRQVSRTGTPVSYTHLDVYKRQTYWGIVIKKIKPITMIVLMTIIGIGGAYLGILG